MIAAASRFRHPGEPKPTRFVILIRREMSSTTPLVITSVTEPSVLPALRITFDNGR
jgi:hypothetical protein